MVEKSVASEINISLTEQGIAVLEVNRPDRSKRRRRGKSDPTDAENAARSLRTKK